MVTNVVYRQHGGRVITFSCLHLQFWESACVRQCVYLANDPHALLRSNLRVAGFEPASGQGILYTPTNTLTVEMCATLHVYYSGRHMRRCLAPH